ncbi:MAG TPA: hypothetical protein VLF71_01115 [Candidatus Saccharimonadales bacterium]|nr:hypothetical protein [Candidatus Saccharimonadales bacterium]
MRQIKQLLRAAATISLSLAFIGFGPAAAQAMPAKALVAGKFQTAANPECAVPDPDCITDQFTGSFIARDELTTVDFTQTSTLITYHDHSVITVTGGKYAGKKFTGEEHGKISVPSGNFHSCAEFTTSDGSGDTLIMHYAGHIDLSNDNDHGGYVGALNSPEHCPQP